MTDWSNESPESKALPLIPASLGGLVAGFALVSSGGGGGGGGGIGIGLLLPGGGIVGF